MDITAGIHVNDGWKPGRGAVDLSAGRLIDRVIAPDEVLQCGSVVFGECEILAHLVIKTLVCVDTSELLFVLQRMIKREKIVYISSRRQGHDLEIRAVSCGGRVAAVVLQLYHRCGEFILGRNAVGGKEKARQ